MVPIDFARNGESYGAKGFTVRTIDELRDAVRPKYVAKYDK